MKLSAILISILLLSLSSIALAQQQPVTPRGRIEGIAFRVGTTEPVSGAKVTVTRVNTTTGANLPLAGAISFISIGNAGAAPPSLPGESGAGRGGPATLPSTPPPLPPIPAVFTDRQGQFVIPDLDAGTYRVLVTNNGYVRQEYGQRVFPGQGTPLTLSAGEVLKDLTVRLTPAGNVSGRIIDNSGQPAVGVPLQLMKATYNQLGQRTFQTAGSARTNDRGEYRLYWVTPGRYYLAGGSAPGPAGGIGGPGAGGNSSPNDPGESYVFTYYPGVTDINRAASIEVRPASEMAMDFVVAKQQLYTIRGRVVDSTANASPASVSVSLSFQTLTGQSGSFSMGQVYNPATGIFAVRDVIPGSYVLQVSAAGATARTPVEVINGDVEGVVLVVSNGVSIGGRIAVENGSLPVSIPRVQLRPVAGGVTTFMGFAPASPAPSPDGTFRLDSVLKGEYRVTVPSLPEYYVKQIQFDRTDALNQSFEVSEATANSAFLDIVLSPNVSQIEGVVTDDRLQPVPGVQAVLIPDKNRDRTDLYKSATTDQTGRFTIRGVAPGDYKVFSWEALENFGYFDPELLKRSEILGKAVHVDESSKLTIETKVIPVVDR